MGRVDEKRIGSRETSLRRALANAGIVVFHCDRTDAVAWAENVPASWSQTSLVGRAPKDFLPAPSADHWLAAKDKAAETGVSQYLEISFPAADGAVWFSAWLDCDRDEQGAVLGLTATAVDITEQKRREQTLRALLREVAHRSKNLLAIIQSIATQTGRHANGIDAFLVRFRGRLQSLASTQDLVTSSNWRGARLQDLVAHQLGRYVADPHAGVNLVGEKPYLNPNAALHIGLALHELAVNSVSYGALARPQGRITLRATRSDVQNGALTLEWSEASTKSDEASQKRFGSAALERVVPASLNGSAQVEFADGKMTYRLTIPPGNFEIE